MISVITPVYNSEKTILDTMKSVYSQEDILIEHIIIDGVSKDKSREIVEKFIMNHQGSHVKYTFISEKDHGMYDAINKGLKIFEGDIVGILNSDDYFSNKKVLFLINKKLKEKKVDAVYGNVKVFDGKNKNVRTIIMGSFKHGDFQKSKHPNHPTFYVKRKIIDLYGSYDLKYSISSDGEYMFRLLEIHKIKHFYIDETLVLMRSGGMSQRGIKSTMKIICETKSYMKKHKKDFSTLMYVFYKLKKIKQFNLFKFKKYKT